MTLLAAEELRQAVQVRFGIAFVVDRKMTGDGPVYRIRPGDLPPAIGFTVDVVVGWRSLEARFTPGSFAANLVREMEGAQAQQRMAFRIFAVSAQKAGATLVFRVNATAVDPGAEQWPSGWTSCDLALRRGNLVWGESATDDDEQLRAWTCRMVGLVVALLPVEPVESVAGEAEGAVVEFVSKRYERSRINRAACIEIQGTRCVVCEIDFGEFYGAMGEGFIHVHHIRPVSKLGGPALINPATDLVPVCPNCHAMLHTSRPPIPPGTLRALLDG